MTLQPQTIAAIHTLLDGLYHLDRRASDPETKLQIVSALLQDDHLLHLKAEIDKLMAV